MSISDGSADAARTFVTVKVGVEDVNDNKPVFDKEEYEYSLKEGVYKMHRLGQIFATDGDVGLNGKVSYSLSDSSLPFVISRDDGSLTVDGTLDRESIPEYRLVFT